MLNGFDVFETLLALFIQTVLLFKIRIRQKVKAIIAGRNVLIHSLGFSLLLHLLLV